MNTRNKFANAAALAATVIIPVSCAAVPGTPAQTRSGEEQAELLSTIVFVSTRDDPTGNPLLAAEIYLMNGDGTNPRRVTENTVGDSFPALSPDGKRIVFDSNRLRAEGAPLNTAHLFVMRTDGLEQTPLTRGSSGTWSPDSKSIAFHASASGAGQPIKSDPGAATTDSDIFIMNVDDFLKHTAKPRNMTNSPAAVDDDPDWSPDGQKIVFTSHAITDNHNNSTTAEIYVMNADGTGMPKRLTNNDEEERAPAWSPDGSRIVFMCRRGGLDFEICAMNADGTGQVQLTDNTVGDLTPSWSPDGEKIVFHRPVGGRGRFQLFLMNSDGTSQVQLTFPPGLNGFPNWGKVRARGPAISRVIGACQRCSL
jgi:TolB protein